MKHPLTKLLAITLAVTLFPVSQLQARLDQDRPDKNRHKGSPDAEMRVAHMSRALDLSDEQSVLLLELFQAVDEERQALREQAMLQVKPQICELLLTTHSEVNKILDEEQLLKLEEMKADRGSRSGRGPGRGMHDLDCSEFEQD